MPRRALGYVMLALVATAGCGKRTAGGDAQEGEGCTSTSDCAPGLACSEDSCRRLCATANECKASQTCDGGLCVEVQNPACTDSSQCITPGPCKVSAAAACQHGACIYQPAADLSRCNLNGGNQNGYCTKGECVECTLAAQCVDPPTQYLTCYDTTCRADHTCIYAVQPGRTCEPEQCSTGFVYAERFCDSSGDCPYQAPPGASCNGYACADATSCLNVCGDDNDCVGGLSCLTNGACEQPRGNGQPCGIDGECTSGFCANGFCCNARCGGNCVACDLTGLEGTCTNDNSACTGNCDACGASGNCQAVPATCGDSICTQCVGGGTAFSCSASICPDVPIDSNYDHTCAVRPDRTVACWGANDFGQLGNNTTSSTATGTAQTVQGLSDAISVAVGN